MKAIRYHGPNQPLQLEEVPRLELQRGEVLVRVTTSGLCHTELHFLSGLLDLGIAPLTLGHEIVGVVESVGPGVEVPREGDSVIIYYYSGCGRCEHCRRGDENLCDDLRAEYGIISNGGFAEHIAVPACNAVPLPPTISDETAAPIGCGVTTAIHAGRLADLRAGATVIGVGSTDVKLQRAQELGADFTINTRRESVTDRVREITHGRGAAVVFELVATRDSMEHSVASLAKRGGLVFIGYSEDAFTVHPLQLVINEANVMGSVGNTLDELHQAVRLVDEGKIKTVVDRCLSLSRFQEGIDALTNGDLVGRAVLVPPIGEAP